MIRLFRHKGLEQFFRTGSKVGILPSHANRLRLQLAMLNSAKGPEDMALPGWRVHSLTTRHWSAWVNGNWRMTFTFEDGDAVLVDYRDYP